MTARIGGIVMIKDFENRAQMYAYVENRIVVDLDRYAKTLMRIGDIFQPDPVGIYNASTGECIVDFGKGYYWTSSNSRRRAPVRHYVTDYDSFVNAGGDIYNHQGFVTIRHQNIKRVPLSDDRPVFFKARYAACGLVDNVLREYHDHYLSAKNIPAWEDLVNLDYINESTRVSEQIETLKTAICADYRELLEKCMWKELLLSMRGGVAVVDVLLDIRIKDYYERKFDEMDAEQRRKDEDEYEGRTIHCT
jgi:hypothetical protein